MTWLSWCFLIAACAFAIAYMIVLGRNREASKILAETSRMLDKQQDLYQKSYEEGKKVGAQMERNRQAGIEMQKLCDDLYGDSAREEIDRINRIWACSKPLYPVLTPLRNELPRGYRPFFDKYGTLIDFDSKVLKTWHSRFPDPEAFRIKRLYDPFEELYKEPDMKFDINVNTQINGKGQIQVDSALTIDGEAQKISTKLVDLQEKAIASALKDLHYIDPKGAVGLRDRIHDIRHTVADCDLGRTHPRLKEQVNSLTNFFYDAVGEPVPPIRDNMFRDVKYVFSDKDFMAGGAYASTAFASRPCKFQVGDIVQHNKTGGEYEILSIASDSAAIERTVYTYRSLKDQRNWVRVRGEMEDGRFTKVGQFKK